MLSRPQIQPYAQFLMGGAAAVVTSSVVAIDASRITVAFVVGVSVIVAACIVMALVWAFKPTVGIAWVSIVPIVDVIACIPIRDAATPVLPAAGLLVLFPITWLAFAFPAVPVTIGVLATVFLPGSAFLIGGRPPQDPGEWALVTAPTLMIALIAAATRAVAYDLRAQRSRADSATTRLAAALRSSSRSAATLGQLLETTPDAVAIFGVDGEVLLVNAPAAEMARRGRIPISLSLSDDDDLLIHLEDRVTPVTVGGSFRADILSGRYSSPQNVWLGAGDEQVAVRFVARPIVMDEGVVGLVFVANDVTELLEAVAVRDRFLDTVGHELRTPLTVIIGHAGMALMEPAPADRERWEAVERSADRLEQTVERMLATGRAEVARHAGESEVRGAVVELVQTSEHSPRGIRIDIVGEPVRARISSRELAVVVGELVRNAVQASPDGGRVEIRIETDADEVRVLVADEGPGMTAAERRQAFDRFYRTPRARAGAVQGLGLGLALAKSTAETAGGRLRLDAGDGGGTVAVLTVPAA